MDPDKVTTSAVIQDLMCARQQKKIQFMSQTIDVFFKKKHINSYPLCMYIEVQTFNSCSCSRTRQEKSGC